MTRTDLIFLEGARWADGRRRRPHRFVGFCLTVAGLVALGPPSYGAELIPLGDLPGGAFASEAREISGDGRVVVGRATSDEGGVSFRWTREGGMESIGRFPGSSSFRSVANAVSFDGSVVVGSGDTVEAPLTGTEGESYRWTETEGLVGLGDLPGGAVQGRASDVSADGAVVVGWSVDSDGFADEGRRAYRWDAASGLQALPHVQTGPGNVTLSVATTVSGDGSTVFGTYLNDTDRRRHAFVWDEAGGTRDLPDVDAGVRSIALSRVNAEGTIGVGFGSRDNDFGDSPLIWRAGEGVTILDSTVGVFLEAMSEDASILAGEAHGGGGSAVVWTEATGIVSLEVFATSLGLDVTGWDFRTIGGLSHDGRHLVGGGLNPDGQFEAFLLVIPEPGTALLLGLGLIGMSFRRSNETRVRLR